MQLLTVKSWQHLETQTVGTISLMTNGYEVPKSAQQDDYENQKDASEHSKKDSVQSNTKIALTTDGYEVPISAQQDGHDNANDYSAYSPKDSAQSNAKTVLMTDGYEVPISALQDGHDNERHDSAHSDEKDVDGESLYECVDRFNRLASYEEIDPENMKISNNLMAAAQLAMGFEPVIRAPPTKPPVNPPERFTRLEGRYRRAISRFVRTKWMIVSIASFIVLLFAFLIYIFKSADNVNKEKCVNTDKCCAMWAGLGQCSKNVDFMRTSCQASCGVCTPEHEIVSECADCNDGCAGWAKSGECSKNRRWMSENCRSSCQLCSSADGDKFWNARSGIQMYPSIANAFTRSGLLLVGTTAVKEKSSLYLWSLGDEENPRLLASCKDTFPPAVQDVFVIIPNSTMVTYSPEKKYSTFALFDMKTCKTISERDIGKEIKWTDASTEELTLATKQEVLTYSLRNNGSTFISSVYPGYPYLSISDNRILVYRDANRTINVYDLKEQATIFAIEDDGTSHDFQITPNGEFLAINTKANAIVMYHVSTHKVLFSYSEPRGTTTLAAISDDGRCFAETAATTMICTLVCFFESTARNDTLIVDSGTNREMTQFERSIADSNEAAMHSMTFRSINDTLHFQYVTIDMGVLKLFKINENERNWDLLTL